MNTTTRTIERNLGFWLVALAINSLLAGHLVHAGVSYSDPAGGWRYSYDGTFAAAKPDASCQNGLCPPGFGLATDTMALDGTWTHNQGDKWDGSAPGAPLSNPNGSITDPDLGPGGTSPGGAGAFVEGSTTFIGIQDAGNPESHGWCQFTMGPCDAPGELVNKTPTNNNRRVYFGHDMTQDGPLASEVVMSVTGVTFSVRVRIPNDPTRLDDIYPEGFPAPAVIPWFQDAPNGHGSPMVNGRGMFNIVQNNPTGAIPDEDTMVGFSLVNSTDVSSFCSASSGSLCSGSGSGGLIMNNLNGNVPTAAIDSASSGTLNMLEIGDNELNEWNEFWITMEKVSGAPGNIRVNVYANGSTTATPFDVTLASRGNAGYADFQNPFLEFGSSTNDGFGSLDMDFFSYQLGVIAPTAAPVANADFDGDGDVDGRDFLTWQRNFNVGTTAAQGDANGDNMVNGADLAIWQSQYGNTPLSATFASVPEPSSLALGLLAALSCALPGRRRK